ncbi:MAG: sigma 54-interacting transcriptional regulator [Labilithrix sp.]|nr:sigma 54-interacting transcriptional regulator [Labilithrix sp.]
MERTLTNTQRDDLGAGAPPLRSPVLYVVLEGERPLSGGLRASLANVKEVRVGRGSARSWSVDTSGVATLEVPDPRMSGKHARLVREDGGWLLEDLGSTNGSFVFGARVESAAIDQATVVTLGATVLYVHPEEEVPEGAQSFLDSTALKSRPRGIGTLVPMVEAQMPRLVRIAMAKLPILLLGESGAGKEVLARTIHAISARTGPFVAINCGALAPTLVESQLFGYLRGAFSGALKDEPGLVRAAHGGTLFLDEIGELPPSAQATLLRVLQEREVLPVGGTKPVPVDLRVVAATLKPIEDSPSFRPDLYARIAAFVHRLAPVRERRADIGLFVADLLPRLAPDRNLRLAPDLATALVSHGWPMNVRELEHVLSVAAVTATEDLLRVEHAGDSLKLPRRSAPPAHLRATGPHQPVPAPIVPAVDEEQKAEEARSSRPLTEEEERLRGELTAALQRTHGNVSEVARTMGKTRMQIHRWMKRFGITPESFRVG